MWILNRQNKFKKIKINLLILLSITTTCNSENIQRIFSTELCIHNNTLTLDNEKYSQCNISLYENKKKLFSELSALLLQNKINAIKLFGNYPEEIQSTDINELKLMTASLSAAALNKIIKIKLAKSSFEKELSKDITEVLLHFKQLEKLDLRWNNFSDEDIVALSSIPTLKVFWLTSNNLTDKSAVALSKLKLTDLDLSDNYLTDKGINALSAVTSLKKLNLSEMGLCDPSVPSHKYKVCIDDKSAFALSKLNLEELDLRADKLTDQGAIYLSSIKSLKVLNLKDNHISDQGAVALSKIKSLKSLNLMNNKIGDEGAIALSKLDLDSLDLSSNHISDKGAIAIAKIKSLSNVRLSDNKIKDTGFIALIKNPQIIDLSLCNNRINSNAIIKFAKLLADPEYNKEKERLHKAEHYHPSIDLRSNKITLTGAKALKNVIPQALNIDLRFNLMSAKGLAATFADNDFIFLAADAGNTYFSDCYCREWYGIGRHLLIDEMADGIGECA